MQVLCSLRMQLSPTCPKGRHYVAEFHSRLAQQQTGCDVMLSGHRTALAPLWAFVASVTISCVLHHQKACSSCSYVCTFQEQIGEFKRTNQVFVLYFSNVFT